MKKKLIILMIDDDEDDQFFFSSALKEIDADIKLETALDGHKGLEHLKNAKVLPDFIFLDINMPRMNGNECLTEIKKNKRLAAIPVIIFSTMSFKAGGIELLNAGADFYLQKPYDATTLPGLIRLIISGDYLKMKKRLHH